MQMESRTGAAKLDNGCSHGKHVTRSQHHCGLQHSIHCCPGRAPIVSAASPRRPELTAPDRDYYIAVTSSHRNRECCSV